MKAFNRAKLTVPIVSVISVLALSAHAQDAGRGEPAAAGHKPTPPSVRTAPPVPQVGRGVPQQQMSRTAPQGAPIHNRMGAGGPPPQGGRFVAHGQVPTRYFGGQGYRGNLAWEGGHWRHEQHEGRYGWWWDVGGVWYYYPERMEGPPTYISEDYVDDDVPVAYAPPPPPPVAYEPPPPPPPADPGASALGGAIVGGLLGGLISGNASGAAAGAIVGGATGVIAGATAASRPGYYVAEGNCYYRYPDGRYVLADPRACY